MWPLEVLASLNRQATELNFCSNCGAKFSKNRRENGPEGKTCLVCGQVISPEGKIIKRGSEETLPQIW